MGGEHGVLFLDDRLPVVSVLLFVGHVDVLLLQDVLALQGQPVVVPAIAGVDVVLLEVMLVGVAHEGLVELGLLGHVGHRGGQEGRREVGRLNLAHGGGRLTQAELRHQWSYLAPGQSTPD